MTAPTGAYVVRNATVTIDSTDYANQCTKAVLTPETPIQTIRTMVPDGVVQDVDSTAWTLELSGIQDWTNSTGLADKLNDGAGTSVTLVLVPRAGSGKPNATCTVTLLPVSFGGEQGKFATFEVKIPVTGAVTFGTVSP
jgi:hypothetical protein